MENAWNKKRATERIKSRLYEIVLFFRVVYIYLTKEKEQGL
jgi:hypothetical protein